MLTKRASRSAAQNDESPSAYRRTAGDLTDDSGCPGWADANLNVSEEVMSSGSRVATGAQMSVLVLADRLLTLAQEAERAGLMDTADHLVQLAHDVFDEEAGLDAFEGGTEADF